MLSATKKAYGKFTESCWDIGFSEQSIDDIFRTQKLDVQWVKNPYKERWFADPFILFADDAIVEVLVEDWCYAERKGLISKLTISRKSWTIIRRDVLLNLPTHLSFPCIERKGEDVFVYPENLASGGLNRYRFKDRNALAWDSEIIREPLADAVLAKVHNQVFLFATKSPDENGKELVIYKQEESGKYEEFQKIQFPDNTARGGGDWIHLEGRTIRVAQDCTLDYGKGIVFQEVNFDGMTFSIKEVFRIYPSSTRICGMHTFNSWKNNLHVVDRWRYRNGLGALFLVQIRNALKRLSKS